MPNLAPFTPWGLLIALILALAACIALIFVVRELRRLRASRRIEAESTHHREIEAAWESYRTAKYAVSQIIDNTPDDTGTALAVDKLAERLRENAITMERLDHADPQPALLASVHESFRAEVDD